MGRRGVRVPLSDRQRGKIVIDKASEFVSQEQKCRQLGVGMDRTARPGADALRRVEVCGGDYGLAKWKWADTGVVSEANSRLAMR